jgi:DNA modification methylase
MARIYAEPPSSDASALLWPADRVERWPIARLIPNARNTRTHSDSQIDQIAASIQQWGWTTPVLVSEAGMIIAGHGRVRAAQKLGLTEVPVMVATGWSKAQIQAYALADNRLALSAGWDEELVALEISELQEIGFDIDLIGFTASELAGFSSNHEGLTDPDEAPEPPVDPVSLCGDVWLLGRHRPLCGDSTSAADVKKALGSVRPHLMVTDPPYGVQYDPNWRNEAPRWTGSKVKLGASALGVVHNDDAADWSGAWALFPGDVAYVWHAALKSAAVEASLFKSGFVPRSQIIWNKMRGVISRGHYHWQHEPCFYAVRKGKSGSWNGSRSETTVWDIAKARTSETGHSTQKPVECMKGPIENHSSFGQAVYEPFSGSGTTIIAAEITGRSCHAIELMPQYVDVAVQRWQAFTGETAKLEGDGQTFAAISADRQSKEPA